MAPLLALDIGDRHTGVAYGDDATGIVFALDTINHQTPDALADALLPILQQKRVSEVLVGLPRLPGGEEGSQSKKVREVAALVRQRSGLPVTFVDERFTSVQRGVRTEQNARSAIAILDVEIARRKRLIDK